MKGTQRAKYDFVTSMIVLIRFITVGIAYDIVVWYLGVVDDSVEHNKKCPKYRAEMQVLKFFISHVLHKVDTHHVEGIYYKQHILLGPISIKLHFFRFFCSNTTLGNFISAFYQMFIALIFNFLNVVRNNADPKGTSNNLNAHAEPEEKVDRRLKNCLRHKKRVEK